MLRAAVWELSGGRCEHPAALGKRCREPGLEMAHIRPRGMGHTGYRDHINNVMCACALHARSTDDLSSGEWEFVAGGRAGLALYVHQLRSEAGFWLPPLLDA